LCGTPFLNVTRMVSPTVARITGPSSPRYSSSALRFCARRAGTRHASPIDQHARSSCTICAGASPRVPRMHACTHACQRLPLATKRLTLQRSTRPCVRGCPSMPSERTHRLPVRARPARARQRACPGTSLVHGRHGQGGGAGAGPGARLAHGERGVRELHILRLDLAPAQRERGRVVPHEAVGGVVVGRRLAAAGVDAERRVVPHALQRRDEVLAHRARARPCASAAI